VRAEHNVSDVHAPRTAHGCREQGKASQGASSMRACFLRHRNGERYVAVHFLSPRRARSAERVHAKRARRVCFRRRSSQCFVRARISLACKRALNHPFMGLLSRSTSHKSTSVPRSLSQTGEETTPPSATQNATGRLQRFPWKGGNRSVRAMGMAIATFSALEDA
jgi:hypothetical protein